MDDYKQVSIETVEENAEKISISMAMWLQLALFDWGFCDILSQSLLYKEQEQQHLSRAWW